MRLGVGEVVGAGAGESLDEDALAAVRELHRSHDGADAPEMEKVVLTRFVDLRISLGEEEHRAIGAEGLVHRQR